MPFEVEYVGLALGYKTESPTWDDVALELAEKDGFELVGHADGKQAMLFMFFYGPGG